MSVSGEGEATPAAYRRAAVAARSDRRDGADDLVWHAPRWVVPVGSVVVAALVAGCFVIFWRGMGTSPRQSAVEAFGVAFGLLVVLSAIGACCLAGRRRDPGGR